MYNAILMTILNLKYLGGLVNGRMVADTTVVSSEITKREHIGTEYAKEFQKDELRRFKLISDDQSSTSGVSKLTLNEIEDLGANCDANNEIYKKYNFKIKRSNNLPIMMSKDIILQKLEKSPVIVLQGATGRLLIF